MRTSRLLALVVTIPLLGCSSGGGSTRPGAGGAGGMEPTPTGGSPGYGGSTPVASGGTGGDSAGGSGGASGASGSGGASGAGGAGGETPPAGDGGPGGSTDDGGGGGVSIPPPPGLNAIFDGTTLNGWVPSSKALGDAMGSWDVQDGALHSLGKLRGTLATMDDYGDFRIIFSVKHLPVTGGDHQPCVLIWCIKPYPNDACGGIQFQVPNGGTWDYRPGKNNAGAGFFTKQAHTTLDRAQWNQCEIVANSATGEINMACCTLTGNTRCKGVPVLSFKDPAWTGKKGPFALQTHNAGLHDEYKDISVEINPADKSLITTK